MSSTYKVIIIVLILVAVVMGGAIFYQKYAGKMNSGYNNQQPVNTGSGSNQPASSGGLTADEKALFYTPGQNATKEETSAYAALVNKLAVAGDTITIKNCTASPEVLKLKYGSTLTVNNTGSSDIHFGVGGSRTLVASGKSAKITTNFKNGVGIYSYGCDDPTLGRAIGVLMLTP